MAMRAAVGGERYLVGGVGGATDGESRVNRHKGTGIGGVGDYTYDGFGLVDEVGIVAPHLKAQCEGVDGVEDRVGNWQDGILVGVGSVVIRVVSHAVVSAVGVRAVAVYDGVARVVGTCAGVDIGPAFGQVVVGTGGGGEACIAVEVVAEGQAGQIGAVGGDGDTFGQTGIGSGRAEGTHRQGVRSVGC